jgi:hypothetical protein
LTSSEAVVMGLTVIPVTAPAITMCHSVLLFPL